MWNSDFRNDIVFPKRRKQIYEDKQNNKNEIM